MTVFSQSESFFDAGARPWESLLTLQVDPSAPAISGLDRATGMVLPDRIISERLAHMPEDLYDLREDSHLVRFCKALLGDSGAGQLRKRYAVAQFQTAMQSTHFYDLDRFYGAIFGISRTTAELLWINPYTEAATQAEWDQIESRDAAYRGRISRLSSAINLGATLPGIKAAAEALVEAEVDVYETWSLLDTYGSGSGGHSWDDMEAMGSWDAIEASVAGPGRPFWSDIERVVQIGRSGASSRSEVVVVPKKNYHQISTEYGAEEAARQRAEDESALVRVLSILKPAGVLLTVDSQGIALHRDAPMANLWSDNNFWEVVNQVSPRSSLISPGGTKVYPLSQRQQDAGVLDGDLRALPRPPWSAQETGSWSYLGDVVSVSSYSYDEAYPDGYDGPGIGTETSLPSDSLVTYQDGSSERFDVSRSLMDQRQAVASYYASEGVLVASPYSSPRIESMTHG